MAYNTYSKRPLSPGSRNIQNSGRISDSRVNEASAEQYRSDRHNSYTSPKSSGGVIPISSETFYNYPPAQNNRSEQQRYDSYAARAVDTAANRSRQPSISETQRNPVVNSTQLPSRSRPTVVQNDIVRPSSPAKVSSGKDYYVTPNASREPRRETHKKVYSVNDGTANLVADVNVSKPNERHHRRRDSETGERPSYVRGPMERDNPRAYHLNGTSSSRRPAKSIEDEGAYSYTDARGMFRDTEPSWRETDVPRRRRDSVDRGSRERPISMLDPSIDPRRLSRDIGPPPSTRGWEKVNEISRSRSVNHRPREGSIPQSPTRARNPISPTEAKIPQSPTRGIYADSRDHYYSASRTTGSDDRKYAPANADRYDQYDYRDTRRPERRNSMSRAPDRSVSRRGFGIRNDSKDRYGRGSDESFEQPNSYRDSAYAFVGPQRRETAPDIGRQHEQKLEKRDRDIEYETREREPAKRDDDSRDYVRDYDRERQPRRDRDTEYEIDRERERERERMAPLQSDADRHHYRSGSYRERDREYDPQDRSPRDSGERIAQPGLSTAAAGGLAAAAAAYGIGSYTNRNGDRDADRDRDPERSRAGSYDQEQGKLSPGRAAAAPTETHSDEAVPYNTERARQPNDDHEKGLGFAFENPPEPPRSAPPMRDHFDTGTSREIVSERDFERAHEDAPPDENQSSLVDADEEYRRRKEQAQRELGRAPDDRSSDADPDRERRRREREQRLRERAQYRNGDASVTGANSYYTDASSAYQMPGSFEEESVEGTDVSSSRTLRRKPSILDEPMGSDQAQIIDNTMSDRKENRVRIVDPPTEEEEKKPKGILKKPKEKFPEHPDDMREGVAPLKDAKHQKHGVPEGAKWTKISRHLVNPDALEEAKERFEERLEFVIVLRVLTREEIQKLADRTAAIRDGRYFEDKDRRAARRRDRERDRRERDEYDDDSENEFKPRAPKLLEAPASSDQADFIRENKERKKEREHDREYHYMSGGNLRRDDNGNRRQPSSLRQPYELSKGEA